MANSYNPATGTIGSDGNFTSYDRGDYDPTTYSEANGINFDNDGMTPDKEFVNPYLGGPELIELAPHLSSIHRAPVYTNEWGGMDDFSYFTTTDTSAPLGGTYSLLSNTGANADAPITYDFLNHMPDTWDRTAGLSAAGDYIGGRGPFGLDASDARYMEDYRNTLNMVADQTASRAFQRKYNDDMAKRLGNYEYGTAYALDSSSPNYGQDPIPLLGEWVHRDPTNTSYADRNTPRAVIEWDEGMGPDYEYSEQNYSGYDGNRFTTTDENGSLILNDYANGGVPAERAGTDFNSGNRFKKITTIPYVPDRINPAVHPEYINRHGVATKWESGYDPNDTINANRNTDADGKSNEYNDNWYQGDGDGNYNFNQGQGQGQWDYYQGQGDYYQGDYYQGQGQGQGNGYYQGINDSSGYNPSYGSPSSGPTGPTFGTDYASAMTNLINSAPSSSGGGFGLGYDSAMTSGIGSDVSSAKSFSTEYEENIKGLLETLRGGS